MTSPRVAPVRFLCAATALLVAGCLDSPAPGPTPGSPGFDGLRAYALVEKQVAFGPRVPGAPGHQAQLDWMLARLDSLAPEVVSDTFEHISSAGDSLVLVNVMARFRPELDRRIVLLTHWDTRPTSDKAADPERRGDPIPGANDGGSGTAVLLELAALMADVPPPLGIDLLFVDGEDFGPTGDDMYLGALRYARQIASGDHVGARPLYGLLLDMVGDADPSFPVEAHSAERASVVVRKVWRAAARLGLSEFFPEAVAGRLYDDHVPLIEAGLPTADLIDFTYGPDNAYWHTPDDVPANVSAATLGMVGRVVTELVYAGG
ncbi:MAG: M28 family peptidase [Gemmatimonadota bacterium]|nr:M28 family peptidase [Gemmatimonadota bacterium]